MYTKQALSELGVRSVMTATQKREFDEQGFFVVENVVPPSALALMRDEFERIHTDENKQGGHEVHIEPGARRVSNIFNKTSAFDMCLEIPEILSAAQYLLGEIKVHGANLRDPVKGFGQQDLHADVPRMFEEDWWVVNAMIMLDDMTPDNGPTRVVPGSQHWAPVNVPVVNQGAWEPEPLSAEDQARVPDDLAAPYPGEILVAVPAGSAVICNSAVWHSGTLKKQDIPRRMLHLTYTRRDLPQQLLQLDYLTSFLFERMSPAHRFLLEIEPPVKGDGILRQPKHAHSGWWN